MRTSIEALEILSAIGPIFFALPLATRRPKEITGWACSLLGTSVVAVLALGLLLKRLTAGCPAPTPTCEAPTTLIHRVPGMVSSCFECSAHTPYGFVVWLNEIALPLQAVTAVLCIIMSFVTTIRFVVWGKRILTRTSR